MTLFRYKEMILFATDNNIKEYMVIQIDTRQKATDLNASIERYILSQGIDVVHSKALVGDYLIPCNGNIAVDTKANMLELYDNLIGDHDRFARECRRARQCEIKLIILIANEDGIRTIDDVAEWKNPLQKKYEIRKADAIEHNIRPPHPPTRNCTLIKIMETMQKRYGVEFRFCKAGAIGQEVVKALTECGNKKSA